VLTHRQLQIVTWGDCDPAGIVYFPRYFEWFDAGTQALFAQAGLKKAAMLEAFGIVGIPLVDARARFIIPSAFGDEVTVESTITAWRRSSFDTQHRVLRGNDLAVEGFETRVWTARDPASPSGLRSKPIPREVIDRFTAPPV
jgi:4-hydroxybenzoyl-CoA thioesterase